MNGRQNIFAEFWAFLKDNKKWWLLPMILVFALFAALIFFSGTPMAPFVYTLF